MLTCTAFNFTHLVNELSFGPYYPSLHNPLDNTLATTESHFHKFQYYLSIVPTIYTDNAAALDSKSRSNPKTRDSLRDTIFTNQYAVTESDRDIAEFAVPGIFFKYDFEPILVTISEEWGGLLALAVRLVNVVSGVLVAGGWCYQLGGWAAEVFGRRAKKGANLGVLNGRAFGDEKVAYD